MARLPASGRLTLVACSVLLCAAAAPAALSGVDGGLFEVSPTASGHGASRVCLPDPVALAQWEHRGAPCTRVVLSTDASGAVIHYTCPAGDFGRSRLTVLTPRTLRLETQGIHNGEPFFYKLHARRVGNC